MRVLSDDYEKVVQLVQKDRAAQFLGQRFMVSGVPLSWGKTALSRFLKESGWEVSPQMGRKGRASAERG